MEFVNVDAYLDEIKAYMPHYVFYRRGYGTPVLVGYGDYCESEKNSKLTDCYCTACNTRYEDGVNKPSAYKHKDIGKCANCGAIVERRAMGRGRSTLREVQNFAVFQGAGGLVRISCVKVELTFQGDDLEPTYNWWEVTRYQLEPYKAIQYTANPEDRAEVMDSEDVGGMTTRELEELLDKYKQQGEQLSMLQEEKEELGREKTNNDRMIHALQQKIQELEQKNAELESAPVEVAVKEVQVHDKKAEKKLKEAEKELKQKDIELQNARALKEKAEQEAITLRNEYEGKLKELQTAAEKPAENSDKSNFKAMLASAYKELTGLIEYISTSEPEDRKTYMQAAYKILNASKDALGKIDPCIEVEGEE